MGCPARGVWPLDLLQVDQRAGALAHIAVRELATVASVIGGPNRGTVLTPCRLRGGECFVAEGAEPVVAAAGQCAGHRHHGASAAEPVGDLLVVGVVGGTGAG